MPRKPKDIYQKLSDKNAQIRKCRERLAQLEEERNQLDKERESFEMTRIFEAAKEHGVPLTEVISLIERYMQKNYKSLVKEYMSTGRSEKRLAGCFLTGTWLNIMKWLTRSILTDIPGEIILVWL